jgi:hypothetical protein
MEGRGRGLTKDSLINKTCDHETALAPPIRLLCSVQLANLFFVIPHVKRNRIILKQLKNCLRPGGPPNL